MRLAVQVALVTARPLLLEGPSGSGKSSLARALANTLGWMYYETVITSHTRLEEMTGYVDVVRRLHMAELAGRRPELTFPRGLASFVQPGALWWAFDPLSAARCAAGSDSSSDVDAEAARDPGIWPQPSAEDPASAVVLIDEIDKADPDLPNNLLVPLGSYELRIEGISQGVKVTRRHRPLVVITTNQERDLSPAFLRRCVVMRVGLPRPAELVEIALGHVDVTRSFAQEVCDRLFEPASVNDWMSPAEFVDAVRAARALLGRPDAELLWEQARAILGWPHAGTPRT